MAWSDKETWCPKPLGIEDVLVPSRTLVSLENLSYFAIFRPYTVEQLHKMTSGPKVDSGWQMPMVQKAMKWASEQIGKSNNSVNDFYSPEKLSESLKSDSGYWSSDAVPTIDCWDFFFWNDEDKESGWNRRIVLDAEWGNGIGSTLEGGSVAAPSTTKIGTRGEFLYDSGKRKYADKLSRCFISNSEICRLWLHSDIILIYSQLGFMLFAICHLQNRLRCKFSDAVFESLLQYFRVHNIEEAERALKINLVDKGIIDNSVQFIPAAERWQPRVDMAQAALAHNRGIMGANSAGFTHDFEFGQERTEKTATQVTAESQAATSLVGAMLAQAYAYQVFEYREDARRFWLKNSKDGDVRAFRLACLKQGVPEDFICSERWDVEPERVLGAGNKMLEIGIADKLMAVRNLLDPEPQREVLRAYVLANSDDPALANRLRTRATSKGYGFHSRRAVGYCCLDDGIAGGNQDWHQSHRIRGYIVASFGYDSAAYQQSGGMATKEEIMGLQNMIA